MLEMMHDLIWLRWRGLRLHNLHYMAFRTDDEYLMVSAHFVPLEIQCVQGLRMVADTMRSESMSWRTALVYFFEELITVEDGFSLPTVLLWWIRRRRFFEL